MMNPKKTSSNSKKVGNTKVVSITTRIVIIFTVSILATSLASNYINLVFNRTELVKLMQELLVKDLNELYDFSNSQYEIYQYSQEEPQAFQSSMKMIETNAFRLQKNQKSITLGLQVHDLRRAEIIFQASKIKKMQYLSDGKAIEKMVRQYQKGIPESSINFYFHGEEYFGVYKYNPKWNAFLIRAEELNEFYQGSRRIFRDISIIIILITFACTLVGIYFIRHITRFIAIITDAIMEMTQNQHLDIIKLEGATNDNITFMGMAFNSLSSSINNLLTVFRRFVNRDIAAQAYREKAVRLEGTQKELTILFSDIKSFTFMTETLGADIINILNLHYQRAIRAIFQYEGIIGSIIGDAVLAVFGVRFEDDEELLNKSYRAVLAGYAIQEEAKLLRIEMGSRRQEILRIKDALTSEEEKVYRAVLVEVGVGIDGGNVFYGNIGSYERMTNTVIGDNVNAASRLEGLTRIYKAPVICSEYIKNDIEQNQPQPNLYFLELDTVQVKGKTVGQKIFWPIPLQIIDNQLKANLQKFSDALNLYYQGCWSEAHQLFSQTNLSVAEVFVSRTRSGQPPENWSKIWSIDQK